MEILRILSEAIMIRSDYNQVTRALEARRKMQTSLKYTHVSENVQSKLDSFTQECDDKRQELKSKLDELLYKLVESELWPSGVPDTKAPATDEVALQQLSDVQARLSALETMIKASEIDASRHKSQSVEQTESQPLLGKKRHRESMSDGRIETHKEIFNHVEHLETRIAEIDNQATQQTDNIIEIVDARIEEKLEGLRVGGSAFRDVEMADGSIADPGAQASPISAGGDREQVTKLTSDLDGFADETANLITKHGSLEADMQRLQAENLALKEQITAVRICTVSPAFY
jgi:hypothetical protein